MSRFCLGMGMAGGEGVAMEVGGSRLAPGGALAPLRRSASAACGVPACVAVADSRARGSRLCGSGRLVECGSGKREGVR